MNILTKNVLFPQEFRTFIRHSGTADSEAWRISCTVPMLLAPCGALSLAGCSSCITGERERNGTAAPAQRTEGPGAGNSQNTGPGPGLEAWQTAEGQDIPGAGACPRLVPGAACRPMALDGCPISCGPGEEPREIYGGSSEGDFVIFHHFLGPSQSLENSR